MKKYFIPFILLIALPTLVFGQVVMVTDKQTKEPLPLVNIIGYNPKVIETTNARGQANLKLFEKTAKIEFYLFGFQKVETTYLELAKNGFKVSMDVMVLSLDQVVVSATRWGQDQDRVPAKITSITTKEVEIFNPQTAADLLAVSGEVFVQKSQQGGGSPMIRGFATNRLLYTIDGVRMNNAIFRGGNVQNVISLDPFAIANTEVFFGPGSVMYGSDAIGAVMSFNTIAPQLSKTDDMLVTGSAFSRTSTANNEFSGHFHINLGWKKWASVTSFSTQNYGDLRMGSKGPEEYLRNYYVARIDSADRIIDNPDPLLQKPTAYSQINVMQKIRFKPNDKWDFEYAFHLSETSQYSRYDRLIETVNGLPRSAVWNYGPQKWMMNLLTITHAGQNKVYDKMTMRLAQQLFEESRIDRNFSGGNRYRLRTQLEEVNAVSANLDFLKIVGKHTFFYGAEVVHNDVTSTGMAVDIRTQNPVDVANRYPQSTWASYAAYLNYQLEIAKHATFQAGVRYNAFAINSDFTANAAFFPFDFETSALNDGATVGSVGIIQRIGNNTTWRINGSTAFRAPNVDDMGKLFDQPNGIVVVPNTDLKAEYAYNGEVGVARIFADVIRLDISAYYTYLSNALVRRDFQVNGQDSILYDGEIRRVQAIQNAAFATVYGVNAELDITLPQGFSIGARFNYQKGVEEMDNGDVSTARHATPWFGLARLNYTYGRANVQFYSMFSGAVSFENLNVEEREKPAIYAIDENGNPYSPGWYTLNIKATYKLTDHFVVSGGVENITDIRYRPYSSGMVAPGRNFILALRANF